MDTDLFGAPMRLDVDFATGWLAEHDELVRNDRVRRLRKTIAIYPEDGFVMPLDTYAVFSEARSTYINGDFVATVMVAQAFVEHRLQAYLEARGERQLARAGLARILRFIRKRGLLDPVVVRGLDHLRNIRNPFAHLRPFDDPHGLGRRSLDQRIDPSELMEREAFTALSLMLTVAVARFPGDR